MELDTLIIILTVIFILVFVAMSLMMLILVLIYKNVITFKEPKSDLISQRKVKSEEPKEVKIQESNEEKITLAGVEYDAKDLPNIFDEWLNGEKKEGN